MPAAQGPQFLNYAIPILKVLRELGGSGRPAEVTDLVIEHLGVSEEEQSQTLKNGNSRVKNQIAWARFYLAKAGYLDASLRGVWSLTEEGVHAQLSRQDVLTLFKEVHSRFQKTSPDNAAETDVDSNELDTDDEILESIDYQTELLNLLRKLPPSGFERICQRLLRESGFQQVTVTGKSSDGGIDGIGVLQINPFVSFKVLFQSKRYQGSVSSSQVRDFRGAMMGRADKGIILTTGSFTVEAGKEARRDGAPPIELVDGSKLVEMFELLELGLKPKKTFDIDYGFFKDFSAE